MYGNSKEELEQAEVNRAKIHRFVKSIVLQIAVFVTILFATAKGNEIAGWIFTGYLVFAHLAGMAYLVLASLPAKKLATGDLTKFKTTLVTPSAKVTRAISTGFSVIEVALFVNFGWFYAAGLWIVLEVVQRLMIRNITHAVALQDSGEVEITGSEDDEAPTKTIVASVTVDEFEEKIAPELDKLQREANQIDARLSKLFADNNGAPPPEGSLNHKEMLELDERKEKLFEEVEAVILRAGGEEPTASE